MSRYHSVCEECGFEDTNDEDTPEDCGHFFFAIVDHYGHEEDEENSEESPVDEMTRIAQEDGFYD